MVGCFLRSSRLEAQEREAILSATGGETTLSDVPEKLRSLRNDADLALYDRHGARKGNERRHGSAHHVNGSDDDGDDMRNSQDPHGEAHDGAHGSDDVGCTAGRWDQPEEPLGQNDDDVFDDDDEEVLALILEE